MHPPYTPMRMHPRRIIDYPLCKIIVCSVSLREENDQENSQKGQYKTPENLGTTKPTPKLKPKNPHTTRNRTPYTRKLSIQDGNLAKII